MKKFRIITVLLLLSSVFAIVFAAPPVYANSALHYWEGITHEGVSVVGDCPITVKSELLTFDIGEFPDVSSGYKENVSTVTASYTFENPADYDVSMTLMFPFGKKPFYSSNVGEENFDDYKITVNGQEVEKRIRYTSLQNIFDSKGNLEELSDDFITKGLFSKDATITIYDYRVSGHQRNTGFYTRVSTKDRVIFCDRNYIRTHEDGTIEISATADGYSEIRIAVIGKPFEEELTWVAAENVIDYEAGKFSDATVSPAKIKKTTLYEYSGIETMGYKGQEAIDIFNALVTRLANMDNAVYSFFELYDVSNVLRWYEYKLDIPAKSTVVNTVTAPLYPSVDGMKDPYVYEYEYLWSPAKSWAQFGSLDVVVNTPHYILDYQKYGFEKTESGYKAHFDGLPDGELEFSMSTVPNPKNVTNWFGVIFVLIIVVPIIVFIAIVTIVTVLIVRHRRRKKALAAQNSAK